MSILIKNAELNKTKTDILISGNKIARIAPKIDAPADKVIDGSNRALIPGLTNAHTHAAMTLMRGYADDMELMPWLEEKIWPLEANLTEEDVYWGSKLACLEMIKTGTTLMVDMYHKLPGTMRAVEDMGMRAMLTLAAFDFDQPEMAERYKKNVQEHFTYYQTNFGLIEFALGPHAIYTVSTELLKWIRDFANANGLRIHTHLSETQGEVDNCIKKYGLRPVEYLESIGLLGNDVSLAHCIYINENEIQMLADSGSQVVHNPASNLKLASGNKFHFTELKEAGVPIFIGTDGTSSGNNLDMFEAMKLASLTGKSAWDDPTKWTAEETFRMGSEETETLTGIKTGRIEEGYLADLSLVRLDVPEMTPNFNLYSNLVYSANGNVVDTVICDGKILMENRKVAGEEEIIKKAAETAYQLVERSHAG